MSTMFTALYTATMAVLASSSNSPINFKRGMRRDVTNNQRTYAVNASDRLQVASDLGSAFVLDELPAFAAEPDPMDEFSANIEDGMSMSRARKILKRSLAQYDPVIMAAPSSSFYERAGENITRSATHVEWHPTKPHLAKRVVDYTIDQCENLLGFTRDQFRRLLAVLDLPAYLRTKSGHKFQVEEALLVMLRRLRDVTTLEKMKIEFNRWPSELSECEL